MYFYPSTGIWDLIVNIFIPQKSLGVRVYIGVCPACLCAGTVIDWWPFPNLPRMCLLAPGDGH